MKKFSKILLQLVSADPKIFIVDNDLSRSSGSGVVGELYPENFINIGVAEQNSMGFAAGLALVGLTPIVHTFASFGSMRACEQVRTGIAYQNLNVKICVSKAGLAASYSGPTHHSTEDLAIMRAIPNMTVVSPKDFGDLDVCLRQAVAQPGPFYIRLPPETVCDRALPQRLELGKGLMVKQGHDLTVAFTGSLFERVEDFVDRLEAAGVSVRLLYFHTVKPLDIELILEGVSGTDAVITIEEHNVFGGFGSAVAELLSERKPTPVLRIGINDVFCCESGLHDEMLSKYCFDPNSAKEHVLRFLSTAHPAKARRGHARS